MDVIALGLHGIAATLWIGGIFFALNLNTMYSALLLKFTLLSALYPLLSALCSLPSALCPLSSGWAGRSLHQLVDHVSRILHIKGAVVGFVIGNRD